MTCATRRILSRDEVRAAIHFGNPPRPPLANALWLNAETRKVLGNLVGQLQQEFPDPHRPGITDGIKRIREQHPDRYSGNSY